MATLKKSKKKVICGVCGGISKFIDPEINPLGIRALFVVLTAFHPFFMIAGYFILAATLRTEMDIFMENK